MNKPTPYVDAQIEAATQRGLADYAAGQFRNPYREGPLYRAWLDGQRAAAVDSARRFKLVLQPVDLSTPEACADRDARIAFHRQQALTRLSQINQANYLRSHHKIRTSQEFFNVLRNTVEACDFPANDATAELKRRLVAFMEELEAEQS